MKIRHYILTAVTLVLLTPVFAEEQPSMKGRFGIGTDFGGIGVRYWTSDTFAIDTSVNIRHSDSDESKNTRYGASTYGALVLKQKSHLRLLALLGTSYIEDDHKSKHDNHIHVNESWQGTIDAGLGVEYSFQELPDLSFGAFVTGLGIGYSERTNKFKVDGVQIDSRFENGITYMTQPSTRFSVRYYF